MARAKDRKNSKSQASMINQILMTKCLNIENWKLKILFDML